MRGRSSTRQRGSFGVIIQILSTLLRMVSVPRLRQVKARARLFHGYWFKRFMHGCHKRMGDVWIPDQPLTMEELLCIQTLLEEDWRFCCLNDNKRRLKIVLTGVSLTSGYVAGLRGEEIPRIELGLVRKH